MPVKHNTILGISPGTRSMGYAVIIDGELVDWGLKTFKGKWSKRREGKILNIFQGLATHYQVSRFALKICRSAHRTRNLDHIYTMLKAAIKKNGLCLSTFSIEKLKRNCSEARNKQGIAQFVMKHFPELYGDSALKIQTDKLTQFEAIAVALCSSET